MFEHVVGVEGAGHCNTLSLRLGRTDGCGSWAERDTG